MAEAAPAARRRRTGAAALVDALLLNGVDRVFCVPGESFLAALDAIRAVSPRIAVVTCRHEAGAANMADAHAKLTGRPGVCLVSRGPGALHAGIGLHTARQDSSPVLMLVGQIARGDRGREAFQEIDLGQVFGSIAKLATEIDHAGLVPEMVSRAMHLALAGRPGPVVLGLPEDMLAEETDAPDAGPATPPTLWPAPADMLRVRDHLARARRPFLLVGGAGWSAEAKLDMEVFAAACALPVGTSFRCQDHFDNDHPGYAGDVGIGPNPALAERVRSADLLLVVGPRLGDMTTGGYTLLQPPRPGPALIHVHAGAEELGRVFRPDLAINASPAAFAAAARALAPVDAAAWAGEAAAAHDAYLRWQAPTDIPGPVQLGRIMAWLRDRLPPDTVVTNGAGNYAAWVHRFLRFRRYRTQLAPTSGAMGYGLPAAIAAAHLHPDRRTVCFAGDGCFLMAASELATAAALGDLPLTIIVVNNGQYGTILMHEAMRYADGAAYSRLSNPDFAALAAAHGMPAWRVGTTEAFAPAFEAAFASPRPALIEVHLDPEALSPTRTLSGLRAVRDAGRGA